MVGLNRMSTDDDPRIGVFTLGCVYKSVFVTRTLYVCVGVRLYARMRVCACARVRTREYDGLFAIKGTMIRR